MEIGQRIKELREKANLTQEELGAKLGLQKAAIQKYEAGKVENIKRATIKKLAEIFSVSPAYIMALDDLSVDTYDNIYKIQTNKVPLIGTIAAGVPIFADECFECYIGVNGEIKADFCLRVKGDSMINARINDGDIVFIRQQPDVLDGEIAAVLIDDDATLKRVYKNDNSVTLVAENPKYKPMVYTSEDDLSIRILGKAVAFQSSLL